MIEHLELYLINFVLGIIGIAFQVGFKVRSLREKAYVANTDFRIKDYLKHDSVSIFLSFMAVMTAIFFIQDTLSYFEQYKAVNLLMKLSFLTLGYAGADIASRLLGRSSSMINKIIDRKTDIADSKDKDEGIQ